MCGSFWLLSTCIRGGRVRMIQSLMEMCMIPCTSDCSPALGSVGWTQSGTLMVLSDDEGVFSGFLSTEPRLAPFRRLTVMRLIGELE